MKIFDPDPKPWNLREYRKESKMLSEHELMIIKSIFMTRNVKHRQQIMKARFFIH